jgi:uncharacterized protein
MADTKTQKLIRRASQTNDAATLRRLTTSTAGSASSTGASSSSAVRTIATTTGSLVTTTSTSQVADAVNHVERGGDTPLLLAARLGHTDAVAALLDAGADVELADKLGTTPLIAAASGRHAACVALLVARGARTARTDQLGHTALWYARQDLSAGGDDDATVRLLASGERLRDAAARGDADAVAAALAEEFPGVGGASPLFDEPDLHRWTALMRAAASGSARCVAALLHRGAAIDAVNVWGSSAALIAALAGHVDALAVLLAGGASRSIKNRDGESIASLLADWEPDAQAALDAAVRTAATSGSSSVFNTGTPSMCLDDSSSANQPTT